MRSIGLLPLAALLPGCQNSSADTALLEKAHQTASLPKCSSLRVTDARQSRVAHSDDVRVILEFAATTTCIDNWLERLDETGWVPQYHGGLASPDGSTSAGSYEGDGYVIWYQHDFEPNVVDLRADFRS